MAVVFTDTFTVVSDIDLASYPSGSPDWAYVRGTVGGLTVNAAADRAYISTGGSSVAAQLINAAAPTGDQAISGDCLTGSYNCGFLLVRASTQSFYTTYVDHTVGNECQIFRRDSATVQTLVASGDRTLPTDSIVAVRLQATGSGATVTVEAQFNGTAVVTFADTSVDRKTTGPPGIGGYHDNPNQDWVDNVSVEDLGGAPPPDRPQQGVRVYGRAAAMRVATM